MTRPLKYKLIKPTIDKINNFHRVKDCIMQDTQSILNEVPIRVWFDKGVFKFTFDYDFHKPLNEMVKIIDNFFNTGCITDNGIKYCFQKYSVDNIEIKSELNRVNGELTKFIENELVSSQV